MERHGELTNFIWSVADLLRHNYKQSEYGRVILPFTVLRRLDGVLSGSKEAVLEAHEKYSGSIDNVDAILEHTSGESFYNTSPYTFTKLLAETANLGDALISYVNGFSQNVRFMLEKFDLVSHVRRLEDANLLFAVLKRFESIDLDPDTVDNTQMGYIYEELIRRFSEQSNETAGEHFTPREVIELMVNVLFALDDEALSTPGVVRSMYDPACGTGGMLTVAQRHLEKLNPQGALQLYGQEINGETYATCVSDMLLKGNDPNSIVYGNTFTEDGMYGRTFDYMLCNPPFGVDWKKYRKEVEGEHKNLGFDGRFGAGTPRVSDGSLLFLQHMISKMNPASKRGSRLAIVFNASPLFTGSAGSGESEIRRWIIENDWLEAIIALPDQLFYNTGISTYVWVLSNRKSSARQGKIQLIDGRERFRKMRKSLGDKRNELGPDDIAHLTKLYAEFAETDDSKIFDNDHFGYQRIRVERPRRYRYIVTDQTVAMVEADRNFTELVEPKKKSKDPEADLAAGMAEQAVIRELLDAMTGLEMTDPKEFEKRLKSEAAHRDLKLATGLRKAIISAASHRDDEVDPETDSKGRLVADTDLRDYENVPLTRAIDEYLHSEVLAYVPDAWVDHDATSKGYEIPLTREFYEYVPPRPLDEINADIRAIEEAIAELLEATEK